MLHAAAAALEMDLRHFPGLEARAFGQRVAGGAKKFSRLDLAVKGEELRHVADGQHPTWVG